MILRSFLSQYRLRAAGLLLCALSLFLLPASLTANNRALNTFINTHELRHANVGFSMRNVRTGQTIASYRGNHYCLPASTTKLVTTAAALEILGPRFRFKTSLQYDGEVRDSVLYGNLYILGGGDPTLGSQHLGDTLFLSQWTSAVRRLGVKQVKGRVVADASIFNEQGVSPKWSWEDLGNYYGMAVYGLSAYDNTCEVYYKTGKVGSQAEVVRTSPRMDSLVIESHVTAASGGGDNAYYYGAPRSFFRTVYGTVPAFKASFASKADIPNPPLLLAEQLTLRLRAEQISVEGAPACLLEHCSPATNRKTFFTQRSPELQEIVQNVNFISNNHYAEHIYRYLGSTSRSSDIQAGSDVLQSFWKSKGVNPDGLIQYDGCGLSPVNAITPDFLVELLTWERRHAAHREAFYASLPVAGESGTVKSLLKNTRLSGHVHCKSGSISRTQCYAGYVEWNGETYAFAVMVNNFRGSRENVKRAIGNLLLALTADSYDDADDEPTDTAPSPSDADGNADSQE